MRKFFVLCSIALTIVPNFALAEMSETCRSKLDGKSATILVANAPGGGYDTYARAISPVLAQQTNMNVRVINNDAGGGLVARRLALSAGSDIVILIEDMIDFFMSATSDENETINTPAIDTLGIVNISPSAWVLTDSLNVADPSLDVLIAAQGTREDSIISVVLAGMALGIQTETVLGYSGTSEYVSALLRGEADMSTMSLETAIKRAQGNPVHVSLILSDSPSENVPNIPYIDGEGGLAEQRSMGMPDAIRLERARYARIASVLSSSIRGLFITKSVPSTIRDCLRGAIDTTLHSQNLADALQAQKRSLAPITGSDATNVALDVLANISGASELLASLFVSQEEPQ